MENLITYNLQKLISSIKLFVINLELENEKYYNFDELFLRTELIMNKYIQLMNQNINNYDKLNEICKNYDINPVFQLIHVWIPNYENYTDEMKNNIVLSIHDIVTKNINLHSNVKWSDKNNI